MIHFTFRCRSIGISFLPSLYASLVFLIPKLLQKQVHSRQSNKLNFPITSRGNGNPAVNYECRHCIQQLISGTLITHVELINI